MSSDILVPGLRTIPTHCGSYYYSLRRKMGMSCAWSVNNAEDGVGFDFTMDGFTVATAAAAIVVVVVAFQERKRKREISGTASVIAVP